MISQGVDMRAETWTNRVALPGPGLPCSPRDSRPSGVASSRRHFAHVSRSRRGRLAELDTVSAEQGILCSSRKTLILTFVSLLAVIRASKHRIRQVAADVCSFKSQLVQFSERV